MGWVDNGDFCGADGNELPKLAGGPTVSRKILAGAPLVCKAMTAKKNLGCLWVFECGQRLRCGRCPFCLHQGEIDSE